jgi:hypothetical protein
MRTPRFLRSRSLARNGSRPMPSTFARSTSVRSGDETIRSKSLPTDGPECAVLLIDSRTIAHFLASNSIDSGSSRALCRMRMRGKRRSRWLWVFASTLQNANARKAPLTAEWRFTLGIWPLRCAPAGVHQTIQVEGRHACVKDGTCGAIHASPFDRRWPT